MFSNIYGKARNTKYSFKNENDNQISPGKFVWTLKRKNI